MTSNTLTLSCQLFRLDGSAGKNPWSGHPVVFVTGTDTGIGKTWISGQLALAALSENQSVAYYKPAQTGCPIDAPEDPDYIKALLPGRVHTECRYCFEPPVAPLVADTGRVIDPQVLQADVRRLSQAYDRLIVEGAGGLMVPLTEDMLMIDLIEALKIPALLVSHCRLGSINHTLLSLEALQARKIPVAGLVINFYPSNPSESSLAVQTLVETLKNFMPADLPVWGCCEVS